MRFIDQLIKMIVQNNSVNLLKQIISKDNEIFIFKIPTTNDEKKTLQKLVNEYGFVLKDYSETFCKVSLNQNNEKPDDICIK